MKNRVADQVRDGYVELIRTKDLEVLIFAFLEKLEYLRTWDV